MSAEVFRLQATIGLNISEFEAELNRAKRSFSSMFDNANLRTPAPEVTAPDGTPIKNFVDDTKGKVANMTENVGTSIKQLPSKIGDAFKSLAGTIGNCLSEIPVKAKEIIGKAGEIVRNLAENVTSSAVSVIKSSVSAGMDFDASISQVAATMGKTTAEITELRDFAQEMGRATAFSATESADALNYMALAGYDAQTSMQMLPNVLNLAAAGGIELAAASDMITDSQSALGLSLDETTELVDKMASASSNSNTSVEQMGDAILTIGGTAKKLSGGTTELATLLGLLANNGIKGAEGGTALRNILNSLISPTAEASKNLEKLGISLYDEAGNVRSVNDVFLDLRTAMDAMATQAERDQLLTTLFNARDLKSVEALLAGVGDGYADLSRKIADSEGAAQKMADVQLDNLAGDITLFQSALEGVQISISDKLTPVFRDCVQTATKGLERVTIALKSANFDTAMSRLARLIQPTIDDIIKKIVEYVPKIVKIISSIVSAIQQVLLNNLPMLAEIGVNILTSLINGISANSTNLINIFPEILSKILELLKTNVPELLSAGMNMVSSIADGIRGNAEEISRNIAEIVAFLASGIAESLPLLATTAVEIIGVLVAGLAEALPSLLASAGEVIVEIGGAMAGKIPEISAKIGEIIGAVLETFNENLSKILTVGADVIGAIVTGIIDNLPDLVESALEIVKTIAEFLAESLPELVPAVVGIIVKIVDILTNPKTLGTLVDASLAIILGLAQGIINSIPELIKCIPELVENLVTALVENVPKIVLAGIEIVATLAETLISPENIKLIFSSGVEILMSLVGGIASLYGELAKIAGGILGEIKANLGDLYESGVDMIKSFIDGIWAKAGELADTVRGIAQGVKDFLGFSEPDKGPLSNFHTFAPDMINLFTKGIRDNKKTLFGETESVAETIASKFSDISPEIRFMSDGIDTSQLSLLRESPDASFSANFSVIPDKIDTYQLNEIGGSLDRTFSANFSVIPDKIDTCQLDEVGGNLDRTFSANFSVIPDKIDTCQLDEVGESLDRTFSANFSVIPDKIDTCQLDEVGGSLDRTFSANFSVIPDKIDTCQLDEVGGSLDRTFSANFSVIPDKIDTYQLDEVDESLDRTFSANFSVIPDKIDTCQLDEVGGSLDRTFSANFSVIPDKIDTSLLSEKILFEKPDFPPASDTPEYVVRANSDRFYAENSNSTTVENLNITIEGGLRLSSDYETEKFVDAVAERLQTRRVRVMRATGGVNI